MRTDWVAIGVPIDSVGRAGGTELTPAAVRDQGLLDRTRPAARRSARPTS